jgi:transmembrane sensor
MGKDRIIYLLKQYSNDKASREEVEEMFEWMRLAGSEEVLKSMIAEDWLEEGNTVSGEGDWEKIWAVVRAGTVAGRRQRLFSMARVGVAAALALMLGGGVLYWVTGKRKAAVPAPVASGHYKNDIIPGGNKAMLTLANGSTIVLDSAQDGTLAQQGSTKIIKLDGGALAYRAAAGSKDNLRSRLAITRLRRPVAVNTGSYCRMEVRYGSMRRLPCVFPLLLPAVSGRWN